MAMSTEDRIAAARQTIAYNAAVAANGGVDPALTAQYGITDPDLPKYLAMVSMPAIIAWGDPAAGGSRSQEQAAARAAVAFAKLGGQSELDRLRSKIQSTPILQSQLAAVTAAGNRGDIFSRVGDAIVAATPTALKITVAVAGADIALGGSLVSGATTGARVASIVAPQAAAPVAIETGVSAAMETAAQLSAANAAGVASASSAIAEMSAAQWAVLTSGEAASVSTAANIAQTLSELPTKPPLPEPAPPRAPMPDIHPAIDNAVKSATKTVSGVATSAAVAKLFPAEQVKKPSPVFAPAAPKPEGVNVGVIAAALATLGLIVSFT